MLDEFMNRQSQALADTETGDSGATPPKTVPEVGGSLAMPLYGRVRQSRRRVARSTPASSAASRTTWF